MKQATPRQVRRASRRLAKYANTHRLHALPHDARRFVAMNGRTHTVRTGLLASLSRNDLDALLRAIKD